MRRPCTKKDAPAKQHGIWRKCLQAQEFGQTTFYVPCVQWKACRRQSLQRDRKNDNSQSIQEHQCTWWAKKDSSSEELWTVNRSRTPTVVLTANGEVHTHEEAQVFVHDLNQFVTVQLLEDTPAVLSLGKLCKDHGYSYEWVSGQEPRSTKNGKSILCKTDNYEPLVVPGLSVNSESSSSSATPSPESLGPGIYSIWELQIQYQGEVTKLTQGNLCRNLREMTRKTRMIH